LEWIAPYKTQQQMSAWQMTSTLSDMILGVFDTVMS
jgi:hypothetical protein